MNLDKFLIIAHRGSRYQAPENTLSAFRKAQKDGANFLEFDIRLTLDKHLVVHHDSRINRTSTGRGHIKRLNLDDLRKHDFGSWFHKEFAQEPIPTLTEVHNAVPELGLNIEMKAHRMETALVEFLEQLPQNHPVIISSFFFSILKRVHKLRPNLNFGIIISQKFGWRSKIKKAAQKDFYSVHMEQRLINSDVLKLCKELGLHLIPWNKKPLTQERLEELLDLGIQAIITDEPAMVKAELIKREIEF